MLTIEQERFLDDPRIQFEAGCWNWLREIIQPSGYGRVWHGKTNKNRELAHRWSYRIWKGPLDKHLQIDHLCRNRKCINPSHLEQVTQAENIRRGERSLKTHCPKGHQYTKDNLSEGRGKRCLTCHREYASMKRAHEKGFLFL